MSASETLCGTGLAILRGKFDDAIGLILEPQEYETKELIGAKKHYMVL